MKVVTALLGSLYETIHMGSGHNSQSCKYLTYARFYDRKIIWNGSLCSCHLKELCVWPARCVWPWEVHLQEHPGDTFSVKSVVKYQFCHETPHC